MNKKLVSLDELTRYDGKIKELIASNSPIQYINCYQNGSIVKPKIDDLDTGIYIINTVLDEVTGEPQICYLKILKDEGNYDEFSCGIGILLFVYREYYEVEEDGQTATCTLGSYIATVNDDTVTTAGFTGSSYSIIQGSYTKYNLPSGNTIYGDYVTTSNIKNPITLQLNTLRTNSASLLYGKIVQYIGTTDANYIQGHFYKCIAPQTLGGSPTWEEVSVQDVPQIEECTNNDIDGLFV